MVQTVDGNDDDGRIDYQKPIPMTEEEFMGGQYKCNCGNSFDSAVALAFHKAAAHLGR